MKTKLNIVYVLVGPTSCGKSYFCNEMKQKLTKQGLRTVILSSDEERRNTFGENLHKYNKQMLQSSEKAFNILYYKLEQLMKYPNRPHFIFVDTTGLSEDFRNDIINIVKKTNYNLGLIVFTYKEKSEYYKHISEEDLEKGKHIIDRHITRLKKDVFKTLSKKKYNFCHNITEKDFSNIKFEIEDLDLYKSTFLTDKENYLVISDIHGHFDEFKKLLELNEIKIEKDRIASSPYSKIIINGDTIDKGKQSKEVLKFLLNNKEHFRFVIGNHENFIYKYLKGEIDINKLNKEILKQFSSAEQYKDDKEFFLLLEEYINLCVPFLQNSYFIVNHAPCKNKYLGLLNFKSLKKQRNYFINDREKALEELRFVQEQSRGNYPLHIFGHIAVKKVSKIKNEIFTDTGAGNNQKLTALELSYKEFKDSYYTKNISVDCEGEPKQEGLEIEKKKEVDFDLLEPKERGRIYWAIDNKVQFISGTMPPSASSDEYGLESLETAISYFESKDYKLEDLVFQPKYMGSRCTLYLNRDIEKCMMTSRKGYRIRRLYDKNGEEITDFVEIYNKFLAKPKLKKLLEDETIETIVLDGELMPWYALGRNLIENTYEKVADCIENELELLKETNFEEALSKVDKAYKDFNFEERHKNEKAKDLEAEIGYTIYKTFLNYKNSNFAPLKDVESNLKEFKNQISLYGSKEEIDYKPFDMLKIIYKDGTEKVKNPKKDSSHDVFWKVNSNGCQKFSKIEELKEWYEIITKDLKLEGCVIKPEFLKDDCIPYMKVRNPRYLKLIYGYDYDDKDNLEYLIRNKRTKKKCQVAIEQFKLGLKLLNFKVDEITKENEDYKQTVAKIIFEEKKETEIDPRL